MGGWNEDGHRHVLGNLQKLPPDYVIVARNEYGDGCVQQLEVSGPRELEVQREMYRRLGAPPSRPPPPGYVTIRDGDLI